MEQYVIFESNNQKFAIDIPQIEKIIEYNDIKIIPDSPDYITGYLQHNNKFLPVVDLKSRFYNLDTNQDNDNKVLVVNWNDGHIGLLVEKVVGINKFSENEYEINIEKKITKDYIHGFFSTNNGTIINLDIKRIFTKEIDNELLSSSNVSIKEQMHQE